MSTMNKAKLLELMERTRFFQMGCNDDPEKEKKMVRAAIAAGCPIFELLTRHKGGKEVSLARFKALLKEFGNDITFLIGSIARSKQVLPFLDAGAVGIVSPWATDDLIANMPMAVGTDRLWIPGGYTPEACMDLHTSKCHYPAWLKLFPGSARADQLKAALAPVKDEFQDNPRLIVTGGVKPTEESIGFWHGAGCSAFAGSMSGDKDEATLTRELKEGMRIAADLCGTGS